MFTTDVQHGTAGHQDFEVRTSRQQIRQLRGCRHEVLKVVQQQQEMLVLQRGFQEGEQRLTSCLFDPEFLGNGGNDQLGITDGSECNEASAVGKLLAQRAQAKQIKQVVFDRAGYRYHGRVKAVADGAREGGLEF